MKEMKKICWNVCLIVAVLLSSSPVQAQEDWRTQFASVLELRDSILKLVPYHDSVYHLTIQKVTLDVDYKYMRFLVDMDKGQNLEVADWYLDYLVRHSCWDFVPLGEKGFEIRMVVQTPKYERKASGGGSYTFSSDDILKALQPPLWQQAREFIGAYARHVASTLPHVTGEGETMVDCRYDEASRVMTTTFEYAGMYWPDVRQYLEENMGAVRKERALALVADTATSLAFAAYKGDVAIKYVFRSCIGCDSIEMVIPPWMWESVYNPGEGSISDTLKMVQYIADEVNKQCPMVIDGATTMIECTFDTAARLMVYSYLVDKTTMQNLRKTPDAMNSLQQSVERAFLSTSGKALGKYVVAAGVRVEYRYSSTASEKPITVALSPSRIREILEKR